MPKVFSKFKIQVTKDQSASDIVNALNKAGYKNNYDGNANIGSCYWYDGTRVHCGYKPIGFTTRTLKQFIALCIDESVGEKISVPYEFLHKAYEAANPKWKEKIKKEVPNFSLEPESYNFGHSYTLNLTSSPLFLAHGIAPKTKDEGKLIAVEVDWKASIEIHDGRQMIRLVKAN